MEMQKSMDSSAASVQKKIDKLSDQTSQNFQEYRATIQRVESLQVYNTQLEKLISAQAAEMESMKNQINEIDGIETGVLPLMLKMTETLVKLVELGSPFLLEERKERVASLKELIDRADVSTGEKFRRIMEAYVIEAEYGRTIEAYRGELVDNGEPRTVDFLRIGRLGLYFQTLDGKRSGRWNKAEQRWESVDSSYRRAILDGLRVARKQAPPEMLKLPVDAPVEIKG